jgi:hypothetical protein
MGQCDQLSQDRLRSRSVLGTGGGADRLHAKSNFLYVGERGCGSCLEIPKSCLELRGLEQLPGNA